MASDEIVWQIINKQFCAFKLKTERANHFCRNTDNVTGLCNRQSCPLANSRYATVREDPKTQRLYLYVKTIERAAYPNRLWERIRLPLSYQKALALLDEHLQYFPKFLIHKCKQRLTRLTQVQIRSRKLAAEEERLGEKLVPKMSKKLRAREATRERKAEAAAKLERTIERELLERLRSGAYGDQPLNVSEQIWKKVLNAMEREGEGVRDEDMDEGEGADDDDDESDAEKRTEAEEDMQEGDVEFVSDVEESDAEEDLQDLENWLDSGADDDDDEEDDEDDEEETDDDDDAVTAGGKRKKGRVVKMNPDRMKKRTPLGKKQKIAQAMEW